MILKRNDGTSLIEILISLVISSILIAALYRTFTSNQKTYTVQEQVVDMQQNLRMAADRVVKEIRMAGFGNVAMVLPATFSGKTFNNVLNPDNGSLTFVLANVSVGTLTTQAAMGQNTIIFTPDPNGDPDLNTGDRGCISIGGVESHKITSVVDNGTKTVTLNDTLLYNHPSIVAWCCHNESPWDAPWMAGAVGVGGFGHGGGGLRRSGAPAAERRATRRSSRT